MAAPGNREIEIKLRVESLGAWRRLLRRHGFRVRQRRSLERNVLFDTSGYRLWRKKAMLRLRSVGRCHWLTLKGLTTTAHHYKEQAEIEMQVRDPDALGSILGALGLRPVFRYEKFRTVLVNRSRWQGGEVMLDETPIGNFLELEGRRAWIRRLARALGAGQKQFISETYISLYADACRRKRRPMTDMVFKGPRRLYREKLSGKQGAWIQLELE